MLPRLKDANCMFLNLLLNVRTDGRQVGPMNRMHWREVRVQLMKEVSIVSAYAEDIASFVCTIGVIHQGAYIKNGVVNNNPIHASPTSSRDVCL
jgi:hypothetical protein